MFQPHPDQNSGGNFGLGDMKPSFFLTPAIPGKVIWGAGPTFVLPTATDSSLGQGEWSIGPSFVALAQPSHWTLGVLVSNVWSFGGESNRPTLNPMLLQYTNWAAPKAKNVWTVPFGGGVGRIMKAEVQPMNLSAQAYANAVSPHGSSSWGVRLTIAFLFPKLTQ